MFNKKNTTGFTLVELLIVVSVITVLSTLTVMYLDNSRMTARDARRIADVKQLQLALKMYYKDLGYYPTVITAGESLANSDTVYLSKIPSNPEPRTDNGCTDQDYQYAQIEGGNRYSLTFCLGEKTDDLNAGLRVATHNGILNCPDNWLAIPGSKDLHTNDFCVMKYEAKCAPGDDLTNGMTKPNTGNNTYSTSNGNGICVGDENDVGVVVSTPKGYSMASVTFSQAKLFCQRLGAHLITNAEWMTIARNVEQIATDNPNTTNWSGGTVGAGDMLNGIRISSLSDESLEEYYVWEHVPLRRTLMLSTGQKIWDFAGSVSEWVDATCYGGEGAEKYENSGNLLQWNSSDLQDYELGVSGPSDSSLVNKGSGDYVGCKSDKNVFIRGGNASDGSSSGVYSLRLTSDGVYIDNLLGFRCVKN